MAVEERRSGWTSRTPEPATGTVLRGTARATLDAVDDRWGSTIAHEGVEAARVERAIRRATESGSLGGADPQWIPFLCNALQVSAFVARESAQVLEHAAGRCLWGPVARCFTLQSGLQARQAQAAILYSIDLEAVAGELPLDRARAQWLGGRAWQPARRTLAAMAVRDDWGELLVAMNVCFDPLVGQLLRYDWGTVLAREHGDLTTPVVAAATQVQQGWIRAWTTETLRACLDHEHDGPHNRELAAGWVERWTTPARDAAAALIDLTSGLGDGAAPDTALGRVVADQRAFAASLGLAGALPG